MTDTAMQAIERKRLAMKIDVKALCVQAGVGRQTYYDALSGLHAPRRETVTRLNHALALFKRALDGDMSPLSASAAYKCALALAAGQLGADANAVLRSDPGRKATADPAWLAESRVRRLAYWITSGQLGFRVTDVGHAAGVAKQAVSLGIKAIEDDDGPDMVRARRQLDEIFAI